MSTQPIARPSKLPNARSLAASRTESSDFVDMLRAVVAPLASLRLTITLFAMAIFIVLVGTLAQTHKNMWDVRNDYFHAWWAWIEFQVFFPPGWFPNLQNVPGAILFPGGKLIGLAMAVNLLAAHLVRFKIQGKGVRLGIGLITIGIGNILILSVIWIGEWTQGSTTTEILTWSRLWQIFVGGMVIIWTAAAGALVYFAMQGNYRTVIYWIFAVPVLISGPFIAWVLWAGDEAYLGNAGMRILWQLMQATFASVVALAGCWLVFKKRSGIVLLHAGIGLIMFGEFLVSIYAVESRISLFEGETATYAEDNRFAELAVVDKSNPKEDDEVVVPQRFLAGKNNISHELLPFDIVPVRFMENMQVVMKRNRRGNSYLSLPSVREAGPNFENFADTGAGLQLAGIPKAKVSGTDASQTEDFAAAYVTLVDKDTDDPIGTYLFSRLIKDEVVQVGSKTYHVALRHKRIHKPIKILLKDVRKDDYPGTNTPMNYSSDIQLYDPETGSDRSVRISMNNPLRYAGETYYQTSYNKINGRELTVLAVVTNLGWMIPYVGCAMVAVGLLAQFSVTLVRFLRREFDGNSAPVALPHDAKKDIAVAADLVPPVKPTKERSLALTIVPILLAVGLGATWVLGMAMPRSSSVGEAHVVEFARLPVLYQGRIKPFDTLAMNSLKIISEKGSFRDRSTATIPTGKDSVEFEVAAVEDNADDGDQTVTLTASATGFAGDTVTVDVVEDEVADDDDNDDSAQSAVAGADDGRPRLTLTIKKATIEEGGSTTATVQRSGDTTRDLVVSLASSDTTELSVPRGKRQPSTRWLVDVISHCDRSLDHKVFRVDNLDLLHTFDLSRRKGFLYSYNELEPNFAEFQRQTRQARSVDKKKLSTFQKKALELDNKIKLFMALREAHRIPDKEVSDGEVIGRMSTMIQFAADLTEMQPPLAVPSAGTERKWDALTTALTANWIREYAQAQRFETSAALAQHLAEGLMDDDEQARLVRAEIVSTLANLFQSRNPELKNEELRDLAVRAVDTLPRHILEALESEAKRNVEQQRLMLIANLTAMITTVNNGTDLDVPQNEAANTMAASLQAYRADDVEKFNKQLERYETLLADAAPAELRVKDTFTNRSVAAMAGSFYHFEAWFNGFSPFDTAGWLYVLAFVIAALGFLLWHQTLKWTAFSLICFTLLLHTFALCARVYISGRPPITNLYSSAVFIGWGCVVLAVILELIFRLGIGNIVATVIGFLTLRVAYALAGDGDTFVVLQAVLDTQFWLATHVVCITLGYATTFLAGGLGIMYIVAHVIGTLTHSESDDLRRALPRMIYGVLCFAIFFSFVGTVLGGLWADDSWGRFWGWDPKENGALIIVLWNALVLHARWAGLAKQRGLAAMAVAGNITTTWSWFGTNELGVGLHSYGFTEGVLYMLMLFVLSQLAIIGIGYLPWHRLAGSRARPA